VTTDPVVSVIVPVYDREHCVVEAVSSILEQTYRAVEVVVVDDGSTDGTLAALTDAFPNEPRLRVFARDHRGVSATRNHGLAQATGEYVTFLDSDDLMVECRVEHQLDFLRASGVDAVLCREEQVVVGDASRPAWLERMPEWWDGYYHMSVLLKTETARDLGFDESMTVGEDVDFIIRLVGAGLTIGKLDEQLVVRRFLGDNLTHQVSDDLRDVLRTVRRHRARTRAAREQERSG